MICHKTRSKPTLLIAVMMFVTGSLPQIVFSQAPFFKGKTLTIIQGRDPGGTGDLRVKALFPFLQKYIPGNPTILAQYIPGSGGRAAANQMYKRVKPDGLTIANPGAGMLTNAVLGATGIEYDIDKFIYLGSLDSVVHWLFYTKRELGLGTLEKLRSTSGLRIGAQSVGHTIYITGRLFAWLLGLKDPKFVVGFGGAELDLALAQGELDGRANLADGLLQRSSDWLDKGLLDLHAIIDVPQGNKHPRFAAVPEIESFARNESERKLVALQRAFRVTGTPFILPPETPKDRAEILRDAFRKIFKDPDFGREYKKLTGDEPSALVAEQLEKLVKEVPRESGVIDLYKKLSGADSLPPR